MRTFLFLCLVSYVVSLSAGLQNYLGGWLYDVTENNIHIHYYSQKLTAGVEIQLDHYIETISQTDFDKSRRTIFTVHGCHNTYTSRFCEEVKDAYLANHDVNVFVVDWREIASKSYTVAWSAVRDVARSLEKLTTALVRNYGLDLSNSLIVGHSLGAHIAGLTGAALDGKIGTIVGLDPDRSFYYEDFKEDRLDETDGKFVQIIHTCPGFVGVDYNVGHADYFANDGIFQPGCDYDWSGACAHGRAYAYFAESLTGGIFKATKCDSFADYQNGACAGNNESYVGQYDVDKTASGTYFFQTNDAPPYAKGY